MLPPVTSESSAVDEIASSCLAVRLRMVNRAVTALYDEALRPFGLTTPQLNILVAVARLGRVTPAALGGVLHMEKSTVSRNMDRLLAAQWIEAARSASGRRQEYAVTAAGAEMLERVREPWRIAQAQAAELLGERGCAALRQAAIKVSTLPAPAAD